MLTRHYSIQDIPVGQPFTVGGVSCRKISSDNFETSDPLFAFMWELGAFSPDMETDTVRQIHLLDMSTVEASYQDTYLVREPAGYIVRIYNSAGTAITEQYFRHLHRAMSYLQSGMTSSV